MGSGDRGGRRIGDPSDWLWQLDDSYGVGLFDDHDFTREAEPGADVDAAAIGAQGWGEPRLRAEGAASGVKKYRRTTPIAARNGRSGLSVAAATGPAGSGPATTNGAGGHGPNVASSGTKKHRRKPAGTPSALVLAAADAGSERLNDDLDTFDTFDAVTPEREPAGAVFSLASSGLEATGQAEPALETTVGDDLEPEVSARYLTLWEALASQLDHDAVPSAPRPPAEPVTPKPHRYLTRFAAGAADGQAAEDTEQPDGSDDPAFDASNVTELETVGSSPHPAAARAARQRSRHRNQRRSRHEGSRATRAGAVAAAIIVLGGAGMTGALTNRRSHGTSFQANVGTATPTTSGTSVEDSSVPPAESTTPPQTSPPPTATGSAAAVPASTPAVQALNQAKRPATTRARTPVAVPQAPRPAPTQVAVASSPTGSNSPGPGNPFFTGATNPPPVPTTAPAPVTTLPPVTTTTAPPATTTTTPAPTTTVPGP